MTHIAQREDVGRVGAKVPSRKAFCSTPWASNLSKAHKTRQHCFSERTMRGMANFAPASGDSNNSIGRVCAFLTERNFILRHSKKNQVELRKTSGSDCEPSTQLVDCFYQCHPKATTNEREPSVYQCHLPVSTSVIYCFYQCHLRS